MTLAVHRLDEGVRPTLLAHFFALSMNDRALRFGRPLANAVIAAYVDGIDFVRDAVFGIRDDRNELVGIAHMAFEGDSAEIGLSVLSDHRRHGLARALLERAAAYARCRAIRELLAHFVARNTPVMRLVRRFGMKVVTRSGEVDARLELRAQAGSASFHNNDCA